jgi:uncharacterized protein YodC (DUF2158 family)
MQKEEKFMSDIKVGDLVQLKSGGPVMTVAFIDSNGAKCVWFDDHNQEKEKVFPLETLKPYENPLYGFTVE